jgi:hypothetical protein
MMFANRSAICCVALNLAAFFFAATPASAQMVTQNVGNIGLNSGFGESLGVGWWLQGPNFDFRTGGPPLQSPFGPQVQPSSIGTGFSGDGFSGGLTLFGGQASTRSISSTSASVTSMNGFPGSIQSGTVRPFVTGFTPVVGDYPMPPVDPTAAIRQAQLDSIALSKMKSQNKRLQQYLERAERAEKSGDIKMARANYRRALMLADPELQMQIRARMQR